MQISYSIVNSFSVSDPKTKKAIGGNGAAVIFAESASQFDDAAQLEIAKAFPDLTEAVFVYPCTSGSADIGMRYWSPQRFCEYSITGHPTIAAVVAMMLYDHPSLVSYRSEYVLETRAGNVALRVDAHSGKVLMGQVTPHFQDVPTEMEAEILAALGVTPADAPTRIKAVNMGLGYFIFKVKDLASLMSMERDLPRLTELNKRFGLNGGAQPYADAKDPEYDLRTRNLDLRPPNASGIWLEDSACGQGSASLMAYLMKYHDQTGAPIRMQQGVLSEPCCVEASGEWSADTLTVFIGGSGYEKERGVLMVAGDTVERVKGDG